MAGSLLDECGELAAERFGEDLGVDRDPGAVEAEDEGRPAAKGGGGDEEDLVGRRREPDADPAHGRRSLPGDDAEVAEVGGWRRALHPAPHDLVGRLADGQLVDTGEGEE